MDNDASRQWAASVDVDIQTGTVKKKGRILIRALSSTRTSGCNDGKTLCISVLSGNVSTFGMLEITWNTWKQVLSLSADESEST